MPTAPSDRETGSDSLDGPAVLRALEAGARALEAQREALNAINVFPVPDGDTGTNMSLTMLAAADGATREADGAHGAARGAAQGALMGARGNSGVILSQILSGIAMVEGAAFGGRAIADGMREGKDAAYRVISKPREGTILTAITAAAEAAAAAAEGGAGGIAALEAAARAAQEATDRTPEMLPVLKEAGVVDAGAQGLAILLDGMVRGARGEALPAARSLGAIDAGWIAQTREVHDAGATSGFCTEFVICGEALDAAGVSARLAEMGDSLLVVPGEGVLRVHVHTKEPDAAIAYGRTLGEVSHEKIEDMEAQFRALSGRRAEAIAVVAVAAGDGLTALFRSLGASAVVHGGQTMNPSAGDIAAAIAESGATQALVLPNNKNIVLAAEQAARTIEGVDIRVVPTVSVPQGVAAMVALNMESTLDENDAAMREAVAAVHTGEVTLAARATTVGGVTVREGQPIGLVDGVLAVAEETIEDAALACVSRLLDAAESAGMVTLYAGEGAADAEGLAQSIREAHSCEVEVVTGGQPHYPYLIGVE